MDGFDEAFEWFECWRISVVIRGGPIGAETVLQELQRRADFSAIPVQTMEEGPNVCLAFSTETIAKRLFGEGTCIIQMPAANGQPATTGQIFLLPPWHTLQLLELL